MLYNSVISPGCFRGDASTKSQTCTQESLNGRLLGKITVDCLESLKATGVAQPAHTIAAYLRSHGIDCCLADAVDHLQGEYHEPGSVEVMVFHRDQLDLLEDEIDKSSEVHSGLHVRSADSLDQPEAGLVDYDILFVWPKPHQESLLEEVTHFLSGLFRGQRTCSGTTVSQQASCEPYGLLFKHDAYGVEAVLMS